MATPGMTRASAAIRVPAARTVSVVCAIALAVVGVLPLVGWAAGWRPLTTFGVDHQPVRPMLAVIFCLLAAFLLGGIGRQGRWQQPIVGWVVTVAGAVGLTTTLAHWDTPADALIFGDTTWYDAVPGSWRIPVLTGVVLILLGIAILLDRRIPALSHALAVIALITAYITGVGRLLGAHEYYEVGNPVTMPLGSAVGFGFATLGILTGSPPRGLLRYLNTRDSAAALVRPVVFVVPFVIPAIAWVLLRGHEAGVIDHPTVAALLGASTLVITTSLAWWAAARQRALAELAERDQLTGLLNRRGFLPRLDDITLRCAQASGVASLLIVDLDGFKAVNDTYGHDRGDELLATIARGLRAATPTQGTVARLGGDEFAILLPHGEVDSAREVAEAALAEVRRASDAVCGAGDVHVTASIGITVCHPGDRTSAELLKRADRAMYHAKESGRNRWSVDVPSPGVGTAS